MESWPAARIQILLESTKASKKQDSPFSPVKKWHANMACFCWAFQKYCRTRHMKNSFRKVSSRYYTNLTFKPLWLIYGLKSAFYEEQPIKNEGEFYCCVSDSNNCGRNSLKSDHGDRKVGSACGTVLGISHARNEAVMLTRPLGYGLGHSSYSGCQIFEYEYAFLADVDCWICITVN